MAGACPRPTHTHSPPPQPTQSPVGGEGGGLPAHLGHPKPRSTINIRNNVDKTVYCSGPLRLPPELGEAGMVGEGSGPRTEVFRLRAVCVLWPLSRLLLRYPVSAVLFPARPSETQNFYCPFKSGLYGRRLLHPSLLLLLLPAAAIVVRAGLLGAELWQESALVSAAGSWRQERQGGGPGMWAG